MNTRDILIACPMTREADALRALLPDDFDVMSTGLGIQRTVPALLARFRKARPAILIFTGSASQLDLSLKMTDIVLPRSWCIEEGPPCFDSDEALLQKLRSAGFVISSKGLTLARPVARAQQREALYARTGAVVFDSVTAAALRVANTADVPCLAPKIVANTVRSGLTRFWQQLDRNLAPLADYLTRMAAVVAEVPVVQNRAG